jgi:hypothetical protein
MAIQRTGERRWLWVAVTGFGLVIIGMIVVALVLVDKPLFGGLVGTWFAEIISGGVMAGSVVMLVGTAMLPIRKSWRGYTLFFWALVAVTSPLFGFLFLLPWSVLVLTMPVVIAIFIKLFRTAPLATEFATVN